MDKLSEPDLDRSSYGQSTDQRLTSNAGVALLHDAEYRHGLIDEVAPNLLDPRSPRRIR